jgi:hypothetical protein
MAAIKSITRERIFSFIIDFLRFGKKKGSRELTLCSL